MHQTKSTVARLPFEAIRHQHLNTHASLIDPPGGPLNEEYRERMSPMLAGGGGSGQAEQRHRGEVGESNLVSSAYICVLISN